MPVCLALAAPCHHHHLAPPTGIDAKPPIDTNPPASPTHHHSFHRLCHHRQQHRIAGVRGVAAAHGAAACRRPGLPPPMGSPGSPRTVGFAGAHRAATLGISHEVVGAHAGNSYMGTGVADNSVAPGRNMRADPPWCILLAPGPPSCFSAAKDGPAGIRLMYDELGKAGHVCT